MWYINKVKNLFEKVSTIIGTDNERKYVNKEVKVVCGIEQSDSHGTMTSFAS